jgi:hypothetical protein
MPGKGPLRKDDSVRARRNKDVIPLKVLYREPDPQPELPGGVDWHMQVVLWWRIWANDPLSAEFTALEWAYLTETAMLLNEFWNGDMKVAGELRLRHAKFGVTPEDRARLRITVVTAQEVEEKAEARANLPSSRDRYRQPPQVG